MEPTRDQLLKALKMAHDAGDTAVVEEFAAKLDAIDNPPVNKATQIMAEAQAGKEEALQQVEAPGTIGKMYDSLVQGTSDAMSTVMGDEVSTQGDQLGRTVPERLVGGAADLLGGVGGAAAEGVIGAGKLVLPQEAEEAIAGGAQAVYQSAPVQGAMNAWDDFEKYSPRAAANISDVGEVAASFLPIKMPGKIAGNLNKRVTGAIAKSNKMRGGGQRKVEVTRMMEPDDNMKQGTVKLKKGAVGQNKEYVPSPYEQEVINAVNEVPDVRPRKSYSENTVAVEKTVKKMDKKLDKDVRGKGVVYIDDFRVTMDEVMEGLKKSPFLVGDAETSAQRIMKMLEEGLDKYIRPDGTIDPGDLLKVRKKLDKDLRKQSKGIFNPETQSAGQLAVREIRTAINQTVNNSVKADVAQSLKKQSLLLSSLDTLKPRAFSEAEGSIRRWINNIERRTGVKHPTTPLAGKATISDVPTAILTGGLAAVVGLKQFATDGYRAFLVNILGHIKNSPLTPGVTAVEKAADIAAIQAILDLDKELREENEE